MNELQRCILNIFKEVADLCDKNGVIYYAIGGTCLGAVRHNGFIPWDDDLDIGIPAEQFERFAELAKRKLPDHLKLYTCNEIKHYRYMFLKVIDIRTTFIEKAELGYTDGYKGVFVDIMPISGIPRQKIKRKMFYEKMELYTKLNFKIRFQKECASLKGRIVSKGMKTIFRVLPYNFFSNRIIKILSQNPLRTSRHLCYVWGADPIGIRFFPSAYFKDTIKIPFEDTHMRCPVCFEKYLRKQFGDYMKLPPKEEQVSHHSGIIDLQRSYMDYKRDKSLTGKKNKG